MPQQKRVRSSKLAPTPGATCVECGEPLPVQAKRCLKCGSYQNKWKRRLQFIATIAASLTLLGGLLLWGVKLVPVLRKQLAWKTELRVIAFNSDRGLTLLNTGDGPVLLSNIALAIEGIGTQSIRINKRVEPGQMLQHDLQGKVAAKGATLLAHLSPAEWRDAVAKAQSRADTACISAIAFADTDPGYAVYASAGRRDPHHFPTLHAGVTLHYFDFRAGGGQVSIPAHAFLFRRSNCLPYPSERLPQQP